MALPDPRLGLCSTPTCMHPTRPSPRQVRCGEGSEAPLQPWRCEAPCGCTLPGCGHACSGRCGQCVPRRVLWALEWLKATMGRYAGLAATEGGVGRCTGSWPSCPTTANGGQHALAAICGQHVAVGAAVRMQCLLTCWRPREVGRESHHMANNNVYTSFPEVPFHPQGVTPTSVGGEEGQDGEGGTPTVQQPGPSVAGADSWQNATAQRLGRGRAAADSAGPPATPAATASPAALGDGDKARLQQLLGGVAPQLLRVRHAAARCELCGCHSDVQWSSSPVHGHAHVGMCDRRSLPYMHTWPVYVHGSNAVGSGAIT